MRYMLTDEMWSVMESSVERTRGRRSGQRPQTSDRLFLEALLYVARTSIPWRDLPKEFGAWDAVYNRFSRWVHSGRLLRLFEFLTSDPQFAEVRRVFLDSSIIRAHQHAAGARRKKTAGGGGWGRSDRPKSKLWAAHAAVLAAKSS